MGVATCVDVVSRPCSRDDAANEDRTQDRTVRAFAAPLAHLTRVTKRFSLSYARRIGPAWTRTSLLTAYFYALGRHLGRHEASANGAVRYLSPASRCCSTSTRLVARVGERRASGRRPFRYQEALTAAWFSA